MSAGAATVPAGAATVSAGAVDGYSVCRSRQCLQEPPPCLQEPSVSAGAATMSARASSVCRSPERPREPEQCRHWACLVRFVRSGEMFTVSTRVRTSQPANQPAIPSLYRILAIRPTNFSSNRIYLLLTDLVASNKCCEANRYAMVDNPYQ